MRARILSILLVLATLLGLFACGDGKEPQDSEMQSGSETGTGDLQETDITGASEYVEKYGDTEACEAWVKKNIDDPDCPPVSFIIDNKKSSDLKWTKVVSDSVKYIDFPDDSPAERNCYTISYICEEYDIEIKMDVTGYPGYPIVEYEATLINNAKGNSKEIRKLNSIDAALLETDSDITMSYCTGASTYGDTDYVYAEQDFKLNGGNNRFMLEVSNGKPTSDYLPCFNIEKADDDGGVIAVMSWQGSWRAVFDYKSSTGFELTAGQYDTDFVLQEGEMHRFPMIVLLYYKDDAQYGQNIYRKWWKQHNLLREQGVRLDRDVLLCSASSGEDIYDYQSTEEHDLLALKQFEESGIIKYGDFFCQDAGWYPYYGEENWSLSVGNWYPDPERYPNGLKPVAEKANELGLKYMLWVEPERAMSGTKVHNDLIDYMVYYREKNNGTIFYLPAAKAGKGSYGLVNLGKEEACDYIIDMLDTLFKENGVEVYRQDFNFFPAPFWTAYDMHESEELGIPRTGRTEEQYCNGYIRLLKTLIERNPGMLIDACASGAMRYDLATARMAFMHTLTDWYSVSAEKAQSDTYTASIWYPNFGRGFAGLGDYNVLSSLSTDVAVGVLSDFNRTSAENTEFNKGTLKQLEIWDEANDYVYDEYYRLTDYIDRNSKDAMALQYYNSEKQEGMVIAYLRDKKQYITVQPYGIDEDANYMVWDAAISSKKELKSGKDIIESGFTFSTTNGAEAKMFIYKKLDKK